ncbi:ferrous iron transport protein A [Aedoeadaptatus coxii]|uniref:FeoA family protein n=1 Tax=Aedoeadaptatus coxii TaxID=755172 RepID=UPI002AD25C35|nr:ferrous iron transport protein A [Peptoniphilus coxii]
MNLSQAQVGKSYQVDKITGKGPLKRRIMDMGITKNTKVFVRKFAPLGDPVQLTVRGYELSLRKADAELVEVTEVETIEEEVK